MIAALEIWSKDGVTPTPQARAGASRFAKAKFQADAFEKYQ